MFLKKQSIMMIILASTSGEKLNFTGMNTLPVAQLELGLHIFKFAERKCQ